MALWEEVMSDVASFLQILSVLELLHRLADELLCVRSCRLECDMLKQGISKLQELLPAATTTTTISSAAGNQQDVDAEMAMGALGIGPANLQPTIDAARDLVDSYNSSSVFRLVRSGRSIRRDMAEMRSRVTDYYDLLFYIHAGVAVSSATSSRLSYIISSSFLK